MVEGFRGGKVVRLDQVVSTMDEARSLPASDLPTVVVARTQTGGRGRFDRSWVSPPEGGLYLTVRIPWNRPLAQAPIVSLGTALALARLASELGCPGISLKWPNDLLLDGRKAAGILAEMHHPPQGAPQLLVGVGINVSIGDQALRSVGQPAVSLAEACGCALELDAVLDRFLRIWEEVDRVLESGGFAAIAPDYRTWSDVAGRVFRIDGPGGTEEAVRVRAILDDGTLEVVALATGRARVLHGGELRSTAPAPEPLGT
jgi:BirA family biotin operon repressor/biotin-[acetyl-CoA-carboxylase] ligase